MKRGSLLILCLLMLVAMVLPVLAAGSAYMGLSASAANLYRGDSFTITVSLTNDQKIGRGAIVLNYDASAFEFVGGSCNVSGATLAEVSAGRKGGVFALAEDRVVSGTIFTIQMKVKSNAAFGSYTISGTPSMEISCGAGNTTVKVACKHNFGAYENVDSSTHKHTCKICNEVEKGKHNWNSGTVKTAATCKSTGTKVYQCKDCKATKEETIPVSSDHPYTGWVKENDNAHKGTCSVCGKTASFAHTWKEVEVTKVATCTTTGSRNMECTFCDAKTTQEIPVADHSYTAFQTVDEKTHTHTCTGCGKEETLDHSYSDRYGYDVNEHYSVCDGCGHTKNPEAHTPGEPATEDTPQTCTVCGRVLKPAGNHVHNFAEELSMDANGHWYGCNGCDEQSGLKLHVYETDCDESCDVCGYIRIPTHAFDHELTTDALGHWYACTGCNEKMGYEAHVPGEEASLQAAQACTVCGVELAPRLTHDHSYDTQLHSHVCICGEQLDAENADVCSICSQDLGLKLRNFPWWILCILEAVAIAALVLLPILRKKKEA